MALRSRLRTQHLASTPVLTRCSCNARSVLYIVRENDAERSLLHAATLGMRAPRRAGHGVLAGVLTERFGG